MAQAVFMAVMGVVAIVGLFLASRATDPAFYYFGLLLALFGIGTSFVVIHRLTGAPPRRSAEEVKERG
jgi:hypothetical protein